MSEGARGERMQGLGASDQRYLYRRSDLGFARADRTVSSVALLPPFLTKQSSYVPSSQKLDGRASYQSFQEKDTQLDFPYHALYDQWEHPLQANRNEPADRSSGVLCDISHLQRLVTRPSPVTLLRRPSKLRACRTSRHLPRLNSMLAACLSHTLPRTHTDHQSLRLRIYSFHRQKSAAPDDFVESATIGGPRLGTQSAWTAR